MRRFADAAAAVERERLRGMMTAARAAQADASGFRRVWDALD
jgi:hypothetical protein